MVLVSGDYGITTDEYAQHKYGEHVLNFYLTGSLDDNALRYSNLYYYGGLFDGLCAGLHRVLPMVDVWDLRHAMNAFFGWIAMVFAALLASRAYGRRAGVLTFLFLLISPRFFGHSMNNPKDIPFATFYIASLYYMFVFADEFPKPARKTLLKLVACIALAINVRVGGVLLICYLGLLSLHLLFRHRIWQERRDLFSLGWKLSGVALGAFLFGTLFWPWAMQNPFIRVPEALQAASHFPWSGHMLFRGELVDASQLPWSYVPVFFGVTAPLIVVLGFLLSPVLLRLELRTKTCWIFFAVVFPVVYVVMAESVLYNGTRHLLFIYPPLVVLAAGAWAQLTRGNGTQRLAAGSLALLLLLLCIEPMRFYFRNHPNEVVYFNPLVGGVAGAYGSYEIDYWGNCYREAMHWIGTESDGPTRFYSARVGNIPALEAVAYSHLQEVENPSEADFIVDLVESAPEKVDWQIAQPGFVHQVEVDGVPLCFIHRGDGLPSPVDERYGGFINAVETAPKSSDWAWHSVPFSGGERSAYRVCLGPICPGIVEWSVMQPIEINGRGVLRLDTLIRGARWLNWIQPVEDRISTYVDNDDFSAVGFRLRRERSLDRYEQTAIFDSNANQLWFQEFKTSKVFGLKELEFEGAYDVPPGVRDMFSSVFYARSFDYSSDEIHALPFFHNERLCEMTLQGQGEGQVTIALGAYDAHRVHLYLECEQRPLVKEPIVLWVSRDPRALLLKFEVPLPWGQFTVELDRYEPGVDLPDVASPDLAR